MTEKPDGTGRTVGGKRREPQQNRHCKWYWRDQSTRYICSRLVKIIMTTTVSLHAFVMSCLSTTSIDHFSMLPFDWTWGWAACACFETNLFAFLMLIMLKKNKLIYNSIIKQGGLYQNKVNSSLISIHNCLHDQEWAAWVGGDFGLWWNAHQTYISLVWIRVEGMLFMEEGHMISTKNT